MEFKHRGHKLIQCEKENQHFFIIGNNYKLHVAYEGGKIDQEKAEELIDDFIELIEQLEV